MDAAGTACGNLNLPLNYDCDYRVTNSDWQVQ
jgi:hypothetical protein